MNPFISYLSCFFQKENRRAASVLLYVTVVASFWKAIPLGPRFITLIKEDDRLSQIGWEQFLLNEGAMRLFSGILFFGIIPLLVVKFLWKERLADYGVTFGVPRFTFRTIFLLTPMMIAGSYFGAKDSSFWAFYPTNPYAFPPGGFFLYHAIIYALFIASWELLFRGVVQRVLTVSYGIPLAVLVQTMATTMLHYGLPMSEWLPCIGVGIFWGFLVIRTKSILSGAVQHAALAISLDYFLFQTLTR